MGRAMSSRPQASRPRESSSYQIHRSPHHQLVRVRVRVRLRLRVRVRVRARVRVRVS